METHAAKLRAAHSVAFGWLGICGSRLRWEFGRLELNENESCTRWLEQFAAQLRVYTAAKRASEITCKMLERIVAGQPLGKGKRGARWRWEVIGMIPEFHGKNNAHSYTAHSTILALSLVVNSKYIEFFCSNFFS